MKFTGVEFRELQRYWYKILEDSGFKDIERFKGDELVLIETSSSIFRNTKKPLKECYFHKMSSELNDEDTLFRNDLEKYVLHRHCEGAMIRTIVDELNTLGTPRHRHTIRHIIMRYQIEWGIRK